MEPIHNISEHLQSALVQNPDEIIAMTREELEVLWYMLDGVQNHGPMTSKMLRGWLAFMSDTLTDPDHRIPLLQALTGALHYTSTNYVTFGVMQVLFDVCTYSVVDDHPTKPGVKINMFKQTAWYRNVRVGIEYLIDYSGGVCPPELLRDQAYA